MNEQPAARRARGPLPWFALLVAGVVASTALALALPAHTRSRSCGTAPLDLPAGTADLPPCAGGAPDSVYVPPHPRLASVNTGGTILATLVVDLDGDGGDDAAVLTNWGTVLLYRHDAAGLTLFATEDVPTSSDRLLARDVDHDGAIDLVAANRAARVIGFVRGRPSGGFEPRRDYLVPKAISALALFDVDGDGLDDLVVGSQGKELGAIDWFPGRRGQGFDMAGFRLHHYGVNTLSRMDVTRDGRPDLVATTEDTCCDGAARILTFARPAAGALGAPVVSRLASPATAPPGFGDFDGDGRMDLVAHTYNGPVYFGAGDGRFTNGNRPVPTGALDIVAADLDGDGFSDLLGRGSSTRRTIEIVYSRGQRIDLGPHLQYAPPAAAASLATIDWDHDRRPELLVGLDDGTLFVVPGDAGLNWDGWAPQADANANDLHVADLDGDARPDLLTVSHSNPGKPGTITPGSVRVFMAGADGLPVIGPSFSLQYWGAVAVGDLDNSGTLDLLIRGGEFRAAAGVGDGRFGSVFGLGFSHPTIRMALADLDEDGRLDVMAMYNLGFAPHLGRPGWVYAPAPLVSPVAAPTAFALGDLDGDGHLDLVYAEATTPAIHLLRGQGDGTFVAGPSAPVGAAPGDLVLSDFDLDGRLDVATSNATGKSISVVALRTDGTFGATRTLSLGVEPHYLAAGDVNGDGRPDLVTGTGRVLLSRCDGTFSPLSAEPFTPNSGAQVRLFDFRGDGHPALAMRLAGSFHVYPHRAPAGTTPCADLLEAHARYDAGQVTVNWRLRGYATEARFRLFRVRAGGDTARVEERYYQGAVRYRVVDAVNTPPLGYLLEMAGSNGRIERIPLAVEGPLPPLVAAFTAARAGTRVALTWSLGRAEPGATFTLLRGVAGGAPAPLDDRLFTGATQYGAFDPLPSRQPSAYWLRATAVDGAVLLVGPATVPVETAGEPLVAALTARRRQRVVEVEWRLAHPDARVTLRLFRAVAGGDRVAVDSTAYDADGPRQVTDLAPSELATDYWLRLDWREEEPEWVGPATVGPYTTIPATLALRALSGNPAGGDVRLEFDMPRDTPVALRVFDATGRRIRTLRDGTDPAGVHAVTWRGDDESGGPAPSGLYFVRLDVPGENRVVRVVRVR